MTAPVVPDKNSYDSKRVQVERMFDKISGNYDLMNRLISLGNDTRWRRKAIQMLEPGKPKRILDVATGTADFAIAALALKPERIIGVDISANMLDVGRDKIKAMQADNLISLQLASGDALPFSDNSFDAVTIGYGVRNFENLEAGLREIYRVMRPGASLVILETSQPESRWQKFCVDLYCDKIVPLLGRLISKNGTAYSYLINSAKNFPYGDAFVQILKQQHFKTATCTPLFFGVSSIYFAIK